MNSEQLLEDLLNTTEKIEGFLQLERMETISVSDKRSIELAAFKLIAAAQVLLPPRGKSATTSCPHCGNDIDISVTKA